MPVKSQLKNKDCSIVCALKPVIKGDRRWPLRPDGAVRVPKYLSLEPLLLYRSIGTKIPVFIPFTFK